MRNQIFEITNFFFTDFDGHEDAYSGSVFKISLGLARVKSLRISVDLGWMNGQDQPDAARQLLGMHCKISDEQV